MPKEAEAAKIDMFEQERREYSAVLKKWYDGGIDTKTQDGIKNDSGILVPTVVSGKDKKMLQEKSITECINPRTGEKFKDVQEYRDFITYCKLLPFVKRLVEETRTLVKDGKMSPRKFDEFTPKDGMVKYGNKEIPIGMIRKISGNERVKNRMDEQIQQQYKLILLVGVRLYILKALENPGSLAFYEKTDIADFLEISSVGTVINESYTEQKAGREGKRLQRRNIFKDLKPNQTVFNFVTGMSDSEQERISILLSQDTPQNIQEMYQSFNKYVQYWYKELDISGITSMQTFKVIMDYRGRIDEKKLEQCINPIDGKKFNMKTFRDFLIDTIDSRIQASEEALAVQLGRKTKEKRPEIQARIVNNLQELHNNLAILYQTSSSLKNNTDGVNIIQLCAALQKYTGTQVY